MSGRPRPSPDCGPSRASLSLEPERSSMAGARQNTRIGFFSPLAPAQDKDTAEPRERLDNTLRSGTTPNSRNVITVQHILGTRGTRTPPRAIRARNLLNDHCLESATLFCCLVDRSAMGTRLGSVGGPHVILNVMLRFSCPRLYMYRSRESNTALRS